MKDIFETNFSRNLSASCLIAAPVLLLISSLTALVEPELYYARYIFAKAGVVMFVFAIFVLVQMLKPHAEKLALIAGGMAIIGAVSGATLVSFIYFRSEMENNGFDTVTIQSLQKLFKQVYMVIVFMPLPGLFFPIGLFILSIELFLKNIVPRPIAITLAIGAILFPFGRIPENSIIVVITDFLFVISLSYISWQVFSSTVNLKKKLNYSQVYKTSGKVL